MEIKINQHVEHGGFDGDDEEYKFIDFFGTYNGEPFSVQVCSGEYDYGHPTPWQGADDLAIVDITEAVMIAVGEYMEEHDIDPGRIT